MLTFYFSGAEGFMTESAVLTAGMVGMEVKLGFSLLWDGLSKTVVFSNGSVTMDVVCTGETVVIPAKILEKPLKRLTVGVYGVSGDGKLVIPTIRAQGPVIRPGVDPSGDPALDPALPIWAQIQGLIGDMGALETEEKASLVAAINELAQIVAEGGAGFGLDATLSQEGMAAEAKAVGDVLTTIAQLIPASSGVLVVTLEGTTASHSPAEIQEALKGTASTAVLTDGSQMFYLTGLSESQAVFRLSYIEDEVACSLLAKVDAEKTVTAEHTYHKNPTYPSTRPNPYALIIGDVSYTGSSEVDATEAVRGLVAEELASVKSHGAAGDGVTDDTGAFQAALAASRIVYVPGGTYVLSGGITVGANCELRLSWDTVLDFTQTDGNCITLDMSAGIRGNHATVRVPYAFSGNVVCVSSAESGEQSAVPPFTKWDPMWKTGRYLTDVNIVKPDERGFHYSVDGTCTGTAVYISADGSAASSYIWGLNFSGLRIAGGFSYGIRAVNVNEGWAHEMRIDAFIDACEIGVSLEDCSCAYVSAIVQPRRAYTADGEYIPYAKHGIQLIRSTNTDLSGSRVWDWNDTNTLWTPGGQYQHIAMVGQCRGTILNDFLYYEQSSADIRELICTDTASNLEQMNILQEPFTRWFRPKDGVPCFSDGETEKPLCLYEDLEGHFQTDRVAAFTDVLATAVDKDGSVFNGIGYIKNGKVWDTAGNLIDNSYHGCTGLIPCKQGDTVYVDGMSFANGDDVDRVLFFDADFNFLVLVNRGNLIGGGSYYAGYTELENGFTVTPQAGLSQMAYLAFNIRTIDIGRNPMISVNAEIGYSYEGFLADGVKVKAENVDGLGALIDEKLGVIENGTY